MKPILTALIALIIIMTSSGVIGEERKKVFAVYSLSDSNDSFRLRKELKAGEELLPGNYDIEAKLSLKSEKINAIFESLNFEPPDGNNSPNEQLQQGWSSLDKTYYWKPNGQENSLTLPLSPEPKGKPASITDFDELHLNFKDRIPENPSLLSLKMIVAWEEPEKKKAPVIINGKQLVSLKSLNLSSTQWKNKGYSYLTKRTLNLTHDSSWNFSQKSKYFFFQNRFHLNLNAVETVDIHFKPNASLEKITSLSCNIRIGFDSPLVPTKIMECVRFPKKIFRSKGNVVLRIWVGDILHSNFNKDNDGYLEEIIFRIPEEQISKIQEQPVDSIQFQTLYQAKTPAINADNKVFENLDNKDQVFIFQTPIKTLSLNQKRLIFPLKRLANITGNKGNVKDITLSIRPRNWGDPSEFLLQDLRLVSYGNKERLAIFDSGEILIARWGGPFFDQEELSQKIEWINVQNFFSFTAPTFHQEHKLTTFLKGVRRGRSNNQATSDPIDFRGIQIHAQNGLQSWHTDNNGLILEGEGNWVEIDWPTQTNFNKNSRIFIDFSEGLENILDLEIKPSIENEELSPVSILPNKPERLIRESKKVNRIKIKIFFHSSPFRLKIKEVAVFQPLLIKPSKFLGTLTLMEEETLLFPKNIQTTLQNQVTVYKGHLSVPLWPKKDSTSKGLSWTTEVNRKVHQVQGLKIMYKIPPAIYSDNPCWLHFTLVSTNQEIKRTLCSEESTNEIIFPAEKLFHGINVQYDEILRHISWKILGKNKLNAKLQPLPIDIAVSLIGYDIQTFRRNLLSRPVLEWNGTALFPTSMEGVSKGNKIPNYFKTNLGTVLIKDKAQGTPLYNLLDHPHFQIKNISLRKKEPISVNDWVSLTIKEPEQLPLPEKKQDAASSKLIVFSLLAGGLWLGWRQKDRLASLKRLFIISPDLAQKQIRVWLFIAAGQYLLGLIFYLTKWETGEDIFLTLAGLALLMAWRSFVWKIRPDLESRHPELAAKVYGGAGTHYIAGFILTLLTAALFIIIQLEPVAEQLAMVGYCMLVVGVFLEFKALRKENREQKGEDESINTETKATQT